VVWEEVQANDCVSSGERGGQKILRTDDDEKKILLSHEKCTNGKKELRGGGTSVLNNLC